MLYHPNIVMSLLRLLCILETLISDVVLVHYIPIVGCPDVSLAPLPL